jgi:hypothetical protein
MKKILALSIVLLIAVAMAAYLYFSNLQIYRQGYQQLLSEIPSDAAMILQFQNEQDLYDILKENSLFDTIAGLQKREEMFLLRTLVAEKTTIEPLTKGQMIFLSFHPSITGKVNYLWSLNLTNILKKDKIFQLFRSKKNEVSELKIKDKSIFQIRLKSLNKSIYISIDEYIARASFDKELLIKSIIKSSEKIDVEFIKTINKGLLKDENAVAKLFINYKEGAILKPFFKNSVAGNFSMFEEFHGNSSLTLNFRKDAIVFNGESYFSSNKNNYLKLFLKQEPIKNTLKELLPYNLANSICYGLSDYEDFHEDLTNLFKSEEELLGIQNEIKVIIAETGLNPDRDLKKIWASEFCTIQLSTFESLAIIKLNNGTQMDLFLEAISSPYSEDIKKIKYKDLFHYYWGGPLKKYEKPFYMIFDNLLIISNSANTLQRYQRDYNSKKFLVNNKEFRQFDQLLSNQSNISFFMHFENSRILMQNLLKKEFAEDYKVNKRGINDLYAVSYQLLSNKDHFFTNFYTAYPIKTPIEEAILATDSLKINK